MTDKEDKELSPEELQNLMHEYKVELARLYRLSSAKKEAIRKNGAPLLEEMLSQCDKDLQKDIAALKEKFGIHY